MFERLTMDEAFSPAIRFVGAEIGIPLEDARQLVTEYAASLGCGPCFENIERDVASLPHPYVLPGGRLWVLYAGGQAAGCVGVRRLSDGCAEMGRLYVRPDYRDQGYGKALALKALETGRAMGSSCMRLYTLPTMVSAIVLYRGMGFRDIPCYTGKPLEGALYMERSL